MSAHTIVLTTCTRQSPSHQRVPGARLSARPTSSNQRLPCAQKHCECDTSTFHTTKAFNEAFARKVHIRELAFTAVCTRFSRALLTTAFHAPAECSPAFPASLEISGWGSQFPGPLRGGMDAIPFRCAHHLCCHQIRCAQRGQPTSKFNAKRRFPTPKRSRVPEEGREAASWPSRAGFADRVRCGCLVCWGSVRILLVSRGAFQWERGMRWEVKGGSACDMGGMFPLRENTKAMSDSDE